jgi:ABC-2 type transport system ATP-binding protein
MIELCGLIREQNKLISELSKGYRQRVGLAQTLIHDPEVLVLDEPTTGLDPNQITQVRNLIKNISERKTVILSTHIMQEVKAICDKVVIINKGEIVADGTLDEIMNRKDDNQKIRVRLSTPLETKNFEELPEVERVTFSGDENAYFIDTKAGLDARSSINKLVTSKKIDLLELAIIEGSLEDVFRNLTKSSD